MSGRWSRLYHGETTVDFYGRRRGWFAFTGVLMAIFVGSLVVQGLNLGIDFKGGVAFEIPSGANMDIAAAREVLADLDLDANSAKIQTLTGTTERVRIQLGELEAEVQSKLKAALEEKAGAEASVASVSSSWGRNITIDALWALAVFFALISVFIAWRFEWRMAVATFSAVVHDIIVSVGVYSVFQLEVTPATVVAFLTILGYSMYDTIVVFDRVNDNVRRFGGAKVSYGDILNVSMNEVFMRSLNTSISSVLPVLSLYVLGSMVFGAVALRDFSLALIVGLATGVYSSIYIATPVLGVLRERSPEYAPLRGQISRGAAMAALMTTGAPASRRTRREGTSANADPTTAPPKGDASVEAVETLLSHPPRPRRKSRR
jgi:preprotein translocase subunit SecF